MSDGKCKVVAIQLGEAALNLIRQDEVPIRVKVALLTEDGSPCGYFAKSNDWSEKTIDALRALADAVEEDCMNHLFEGESAAVAPTSETDREGSPPQF